MKKAVRGRNLFMRFKIPLFLLAKIMSFLPNWFCKLLWNLTDGWAGLIGIGLRYSILGAKAKRCGNNVSMGPYIYIGDMNKLSLGDNVSIHRGCYIEAAGGLIVGNNVSIAHGTSILTAEHTWADKSIPIKDNEVVYAPVVICDDVWIGCGCRILSGVTINTHSIVAAGAVVTRDVENNTIVGGIPCKVIRN